MKTIKNILSFLLAFLLMFFLFGTVISSELVTLTGNSDIYKKIACSESVTYKQMTIIDNRIDELASEFGFDPEPVRKLVTAEAVRQYAGQCVDWWMGLLNGTKTGDAPVWPYENIMNAVREDENFIATVEKYEQRTVARDKIAVPLINTVKACTLCVRSELVNPLFDKVNERFDLQYYSRLLKVTQWICGLISLLVAALIILTLPGKRAWHTVGYASGAVALLLAAVIITFRTAGIQSMIAEASAILSIQADALLNGITLRLMIPVVICIGGYGFLTMKGKKKTDEVPKDHC